MSSIAEIRAEFIAKKIAEFKAGAERSDGPGLGQGLTSAPRPTAHQPAHPTDNIADTDEKSTTNSDLKDDTAHTPEFEVVELKCH